MTGDEDGEARVQASTTYLQEFPRLGRAPHRSGLRIDPNGIFIISIISCTYRNTRRPRLQRQEFLGEFLRCGTAPPCRGAHPFQSRANGLPTGKHTSTIYGRQAVITAHLRALDGWRAWYRVRLLMVSILSIPRGCGCGCCYRSVCSVAFAIRAECGPFQSRPRLELGPDNPRHRVKSVHCFLRRFAQKVRNLFQYKLDGRGGRAEGVIICCLL